VKRLSQEVRGAVVRLNKTRVDPEQRKVTEAIKDGSFSEERLARGDYALSQDE